MFFLTKDLSKAIMARFRLCNNFLNNKKEVNRALYVLSNFVQNLNISLFPDSDPLIWNIEDLNLKSILKYRKHSSIIAIKSKYRYASSFILVEINETDIGKDISNLNGNKDSQNLHIPTKVIKQNSNIFSRFLCTNFDSSIKTSKFPRSPKLGDITISIKKVKMIKKNYRLVSTLRSLSKLSERCIFI